MAQNLLVIKKTYLFFVIIAIVFFVVGFLLKSFYPRIPTGKITAGEVKLTPVEKCKLFCEFADAEYDHLGRDSHCYCNREQTLFDVINNRTIIVTQTIDAGVIKDLVIEEGISEEAQRQIQETIQ